MNQQSTSSAGAEHGANLTPAARELLDEYVNQYRLNLISEATRAGDQDVDLRVYDIRKVAASSLASKRTLTLFVVGAVLSGTLLGVTIIVVISYAFSDNDSTSPTASVLVSIASLLVAIISLAATWAAFRVSSASGQRAENFLREVANLEMLARSTVERLFGSNDESLVKVLATLERRGVFTDRDALDFSRIMKLRNSLVHERVRSLHPDERLEAIREIRRLRTKLQLAQNRQKAAAQTADLALEAKNYEELVHQALRRIRPDAQIVTLRDGQCADFLIDDPKGSVSVVAKYMTRPLSQSDMLEIARKTRRSRALPVLIVSNSQLSTKLDEFMSARSREGFSFIRWSGERDDDILVSCLNNLLGDDHPDTLSTADNLGRDLIELGERAAADQLQEWIRSQRET